MHLQLGCGLFPDKKYFNVDVFPWEGVDKIVDLSKFPWDWEDNSIDSIYSSHCIEHIFDQESFLKECHRILKPGGELFLKVPHVTSVTSQGCMGHFRGYCFDTFKDYLSKDYYMFKKTMFKTTYQRLVWFRTDWTKANHVNLFLRVILQGMSPVMDFLININPRFFENTWIYLIGGVREVVWKGIKVETKSDDSHTGV